MSLRAGAIMLTLVVAPTVAYAQASIGGVIRDSSGGVLPGVTVEATSPALIERVRIAASDRGGQYRIVDLRPGTYSVTFTLEGFTTVRQDRIELTGSFAATINVEMRVGEIAETITVTGEAPVVDVESSTRQAVLDDEVLASVPAGRNQYALAQLIPGLSSNQADVGGTTELDRTNMTAHGSRAGDQRVTLEGLSIANAEITGDAANYVPNMGSVQEITIDFGLGSAEAATGGVRLNVIPKEGGNTFSGSFYGTAVNSRFQGSNFTQRLQDAGLSVPRGIKLLRDINPSGGGPIARNRVWFYAAGRWSETSEWVPGMFYNLNAGDVTKWTYEPDFSRQGDNATTLRSLNARVTWQATQKDKIAFFYDNQDRCDCPATAATTSPDGANSFEYPTNFLVTSTWTSTLNGRLLLDVKGLYHGEKYAIPPPDDLNLIRVQDQGGFIPGLNYRSPGRNFLNVNQRIGSLASSLTYVPGAHAIKVGFLGTWAERDSQEPGNLSGLEYRFRDGVPNRITMRASPLRHRQIQSPDLGIYAQDRWKIDQLTLNAGLRFDYFATRFPAEHLGPGPNLPTRDITAPAQDWASVTDLTPRLGAVYDLRGDGRTAIKVGINKYVEARGIGISFATNSAPISEPYGAVGHLVNRLATSTTRTWTDANGNFVPDCDLANLEAQDGRAVGGDFCGRVSDLSFGQERPSTSFDPATLTGFGQRPYQWEFSAAVQHELVRRVSVDVGYYRRWVGNFMVAQNRSVTEADYTPFSVMAPVDPRLPGGGGYLVTDLYNLNQDKLGQVDNYLTYADNFGKKIEHWNGVDVSVNARLDNGVLLQGGISSGRTTQDDCEVVAQLGSPSRRFCHFETPFLTDVKLFASYTVPTIDVQLGLAFQSTPGPQIGANVIYANAEVEPSLGRPLSGGAPTVTVQVVEPGTLYGERLNQLDLRFTKLFTFGPTRTRFNVDVYNVMNSDTILGVNGNYGQRWLAPTSVLTARFVRLGVQFDF